MPKVLVLIEYLRQDYFTNGKLDYAKSNTGKEFIKVLKSIGMIYNKDYVFDYVYTKIPEVKNRDYYGNITSYNVPKAKLSSMEPYYERLRSKVIDSEVDLVIPTGPLGIACMKYLGFSKVDYSFPRSLKTDSKSTKWTIPIYSQERIDLDPNLAFKRNIGFAYIKDYLLDGSIDSNLGGYKSVFLDDYDKTMEVLNKAINSPLVALDTETNTLDAYTKGAKILVFTIAMDPNTGYEIPIYHRDFKGWSSDQLNNIIKKIAQIYANDNYKVMHNSKYDLSMIMYTFKDYNFNFNKVIDTKDGYYLTINQAVKESLRLTDLSKELTDMGGYDDPLEDFHKWVSQVLLKGAYEILKGKIKEAQDNLDKKDELYKVKKEQLKDSVMLSDTDIPSILENTDLSIFNKYKFNQDEIINKLLIPIIIPQINEHRHESMANMLVNEVDGGKFNYDWIPLSIMTPYACGDAVATYRCCQWEKNYMLSDTEDPQHKILDLWLNFYPKIVLGLVWIQNFGIAVDIDYMNNLQESYQNEYDRLMKELTNLPASQAVIEYKQNLYDIGLKEFQKSKYHLVFDIDGKPLKAKDANLDDTDKAEFMEYDKLYREYTHKGSNLEYPKELKKAGYRDEDLVVYRNKFKNSLGFTGTPFDIRYALFNFLEAEVPFDSDYFGDSAWKKMNSKEDATWQDYSLSAKTTLKYIQDNGSKPQKEYANLLVELAKVKTLKSDFTDKLKKHLSNVDGYSHGSFSETGTETSRLSASNPNMQQLPHATTDVGRFDYQNPIKREFISRFPNGVLHNIDYANLEMRIAGLISGDKGMYDTFVNGEDIHKATAAQALGILEDEVTRQMRQNAKSLNFGILYGRGSASVAKQTNQTVEEAEDFEKKYMDAKPEMKKFIDDSHKFVEDNGYVLTVPGFRRWLRGIWSRDRGESKKALRQSVNTIVQGTGTFLTNTAIYYINKYFIDNKMKSRVVLTVHDSVVVDSPADEAAKAGQKAEYIMENLPYDWLIVTINGKKVRYPIEAEDSIGLTYNDMVDFNYDDFKTFNSPQGYCKYYYEISQLSDQKDSNYFSDDDQENSDIYDKRLEELKERKHEYQEI